MSGTNSNLPNNIENDKITFVKSGIVEKLLIGPKWLNAGPALLIEVTVNDIASSKSFIWNVTKNNIITKTKPNKSSLLKE